MQVAQMGPIWVPYNSPIKKKNAIIIFISTYFLVYNAWLASTVADTEGIHVVRLNPHLRQNYSIFMRNFKQNQQKLSNNHIQFSNWNFFCKFEPPSKKSWIRPCFCHLLYFIYLGQPIWDPVALPIWVATWDPYGSHIWVPYRLLAG